MPVDPTLAAAIESDRAGASASYEVGPEDVLEVSVWKEDGLKREILVRPDGGISFPLAGDFKVAGKTPAEIQSALSQRLEKFIPDPVVSVLVLKAANYHVFVVGRVNKPGDFTSGQPLDVLQTLSMAGGLTPYASEDGIHVVRRVDGRAVSIPFDYGRVSRGRDLDQNIVLRSGDIVVVP